MTYVHNHHYRTSSDIRNQTYNSFSNIVKKISVIALSIFLSILSFCLFPPLLALGLSSVFIISALTYKPEYQNSDIEIVNQPPVIIDNTPNNPARINIFIPPLPIFLQKQHISTLPSKVYAPHLNPRHIPPFFSTPRHAPVGRGNFSTVSPLTRNPTNTTLLFNFGRGSSHATVKDTKRK